ncbi:MAG: hypothetical protein EON60_07650 [Alphaproteobacteria bacterium]|nr:MAG: hypothetical protein EON60_07650 [Alphaproteobacteria bacterium]
MMLGRFIKRIVIGLSLLFACAGVSSAGSVDDEIHIVGRLVSVEPAPGCGMFLLGSPATYQVISGPEGLVGSQIQVLIACIEMPLIEGDVNIFNVGDTHALIVTHHNVNKIELPDSPDSSLFYLKAASFLAIQPNNSFKPSPHQGGA